METVESNVVVEGAVEAGAKAEREPRVPLTTFIQAWESSDSVAQVAEKTGLKQNSVQARASKYRSQGIPLKEMPRGGGAKLDIAEAQALLAKLRGVAVETVKEAADEAEVERAERKAKREAKETEAVAK